MRNKAEEEEKKKLPPCLKQDRKVTAGVLLSDQIKRLSTGKYKLIDPFEEKNLKPAAYQLTVGSDYAIRGVRGKLYDERGRNELIIPPFEVAIITTAETINLPRFLIARWNLRVKWAYEGLLWLGALQVDAGWVGYLPCPIYNLSNKDVKLKLGDQIAVMDFVTTTHFDARKCIEYDRPPKRRTLDDYNTKLESGLYTETVGKIESFEKRVDRSESTLHTSLATIFTSLVIIVAVLSIYFTSTQTTVTYNLAIWQIISLVISVIALGLAAASFSRTQRRSGS